MEPMPLVSVPVITYNSAKYVLETLESIKAQTYQNIELIVSDDCSTDNTVEICRDWMENNKDRFVRTELLTTPVNTGISANGNRAEAASKGEWVKPIAGDDLLMPECIATYIDYVKKHKDALYVFSKMRVFGCNMRKYSYIEKAFDERNDRMEGMSLEEQRKEVNQGNTPPAPTVFYNRHKSVELGIHNDERIRNIEDWPKWINILKRGIKLRFIDQYLVKYRIGGISTSSRWQSVDSFRAQRQIFFYYFFDELYKKDPGSAINTLIEYECRMYEDCIQGRICFLSRMYNRISHIFK